MDAMGAAIPVLGLLIALVSARGFSKDRWIPWCAGMTVFVWSVQITCLKRLCSGGEQHLISSRSGTHLGDLERLVQTPPNGWWGIPVSEGDRQVDARVIRANRCEHLLGNQSLTPLELLDFGFVLMTSPPPQ